MDWNATLIWLSRILATINAILKLLDILIIAPKIFLFLNLYVLVFRHLKYFFYMYFLRNIKSIIKGFEFYYILFFTYTTFFFYIYIMCITLVQYAGFLLISKLDHIIKCKKLISIVFLFNLFVVTMNLSPPMVTLS